MLKKITFLSFILLSVVTSAQNWQTVRLGENKFFEKNGYPTQATRIDSVSLSGSDSIFYNFFTHDNNGVCIDTLAPSWIGRKILVENSGRNVFFNYFNDSVVIKTNAPLGSSWHLYDFASGDYFQATVTYSGLQLIGAASDSIKEISIVRKNSSGVIVSNVFNGKKITISQNNGIIGLFNMKYFPQVFLLPADTLNYIYNPNLHLLTRGEVYNYTIGDEIAYQQSCNGAPGCITLRTVLDKWYSTTSDTVFYKLQYVTQCTTIVPPPPNPYGLAYSTTIDTQTVFYTNLSDLLITKMPGEYSLIPFGIFAAVDYYNFDNSECGYETYTTVSSQYYFDVTCYVVAFEPHVISNLYISGFGGPFLQQNNDLGGPSFCSGNILYMNKVGGAVCGTAPLFVGIAEIASNKNNVELFPNPNEGVFTLNFNNPNSFADNRLIQIYTIDGRLIKNIVFDTNSGINHFNIAVPELSDGLYFLKAGQQIIKFTVLK